MEKELFFKLNPNSDGVTRKMRLKEALWEIINDTLFCWSLRNMNRFRVWLLRKFGAKIGARVGIHNKVKVFRPWNLEIGNSVYIDRGVNLRSSAKIVIKDNVGIATCVTILPGGHNVKSRGMEWVGTSTIINSGCFIGACSLIKGVTIGQFTCVGAGSFVTKDLPENVIAFGWPAKVHSERLPQEEYEKYRYDGMP